jgi:hypothetical protein
MLVFCNNNVFNYVWLCIYPILYINTHIYKHILIDYYIQVAYTHTHICKWNEW